MFKERIKQVSKVQVRSLLSHVMSTSQSWSCDGFCLRNVIKIACQFPGIELHAFDLPGFCEVSEELKDRCFVFLLHGLYLATENTEIPSVVKLSLAGQPVEKEDETFSQATVEESCRLDANKASKHMLLHTKI